MRALSVAIIFSCAASLLAQEFRGAIRGRVTDPSGAVIVGAQIHVTNLDTGVVVDATTNNEGNYQAPFLLPGNYSVVVEQAGFKKAQRDNIRVGTGAQVAIDLSLELGASTETITVKGEAPLLATTGADLGQVVSTSYITNVVTSVYRNAINLTRMAAGITGASQGTYTSDNMSQISINGGGATQGGNEVIIDGVPNTVPLSTGSIVVVPTVDSIEEMKVHTTMFDASYGHSNGGAIDIVTKTGSNDLHGTAYFFKRWKALNANTWANNKNGLPKGPIRYRLYGYFLSGPVYLPKMYNGRNRTFFSSAFEDDNDNRDLGRQARVPTALERQGDFSQTLARNGRAPIVIYDPFTTQVVGGKGTRQPFPGAKITPSLLSPIGLAVLGALPLPTMQVPPQIGVNDWASAKTYRVGQREISVRIDHLVSDRQRLFGRYSRLIRDQAAETLIEGVRQYGGSGADIDTYKQWRHSFVLDDTYTFSPSLVGSLRYGFTRRHNYETWGGVGMDPAKLKVPEVIVKNQTLKGYPNFDIGESVPTIGSQLSKLANDLHSLFATFTKLNGNHGLKFGTDYRVVRYSSASQGAAAGATWSFDSGFTRSDFSSSSTGDTSGSGMASLLLGLASGGQFGYTSPLSLQQHYLGAFIQDDWKITNRLTLNLGLRYELETPYNERYNRVLYGFDPSASLPVKVPGLNLRGGALFAGVGGLGRGEGLTDKNNFGPRFGFAYKVFSKTVIRGGYGLFYSGQTINIGFLGGVGSFDALTSYLGSTDNGATPFSTLANPYPNGLVTAVGSSAGVMAQVGNDLTFASQNRRSPYNQQWQLSMQRELPSQMVFEAAYVGMLSVKGLEGFNLNEIPDAYLPLGAARNSTVPNPFYGVLANTTVLGQGSTFSQSRLWAAYPQFTSLTVQGLNSGASTYNSLQLRLEKRLSHGLSLLGTYTFSKLMRNNTTSVVNERHYRSISSLDQPHLFRLVTTYELPFKFAGGGARRILRPVLGGWAIANFLIIESGRPMSISEANGRPVMIADPRISSPINQRLGDRKDAQGNILNPYFKLDAFRALPTQYMVSPQAPYVSWLRGPRNSSTNTSIFKNFAIHERMHLEVRLEAVNATNHPYFNTPGTSMSTKGTFGVITGASNSRTMQGGAKLIF